jgi:hypothetical protein
LRSSAEPLCEDGVGSALIYPSGASPCPFGEYGAFFSPRYQTLLQQVGRDDNVRTLLEAIRDGFEFAKEAAILRNIQPGSMQVKILDEMLQCVAKSAEFVKSYAEDVQIGTSS